MTLTAKDRAALKTFARSSPLAQSNRTDLAAGLIYWGTIDRLVAAGLVERVGRNDRWQDLFALTPTGQLAINAGGRE